MGLRCGQAATAWRRHLSAEVMLHRMGAALVALVAGFGLAFVMAASVGAASPPPACATGVTSAGQLSVGQSCTLGNGTVITGTAVTYGNPNQAVVKGIVTPMEQTAGTIRLVLFGVTLLVGAIGILLRSSMIHSTELKMLGSRAITDSVIGLLVMVFLPLIIGWLAGFNIPVT